MEKLFITSLDGIFTLFCVNFISSIKLFSIKEFVKAFLSEFPIKINYDFFWSGWKLWLSCVFPWVGGWFVLSHKGNMVALFGTYFCVMVSDRVLTMSDVCCSLLLYQSLFCNIFWRTRVIPEVSHPSWPQ